MTVQTGPLQLRRLTTSQLGSVTPAPGEPVVNTTTKQLVIGDGTTVGGIGVAPIASPALTGVPTTPTAAPGTNTTQVASTAFVEAARVILVAADALKAPLASPALTGVPTAPTAAPGTNTTQVATTAFVDAVRVILAAASALNAPLASPALTGVPTAPTAAPGTNTTQLATTAFVEAARVILAAADALKAPLASPALTGVPTAPTAAIGTNTTQIATTAALQARILGTVSQSAGVPTGTILETGGVLSGTGVYTKYADGTMVITKVLTIATGSTTAKGSIFGSAATAAGSWPVTWVGNAPVVQASGTDSTGGGWAAMDGLPTLSVWGSYSTRAHVSQGTSGTIYLTAIGRWF
jgi:hypothetical protein